MLKAAVTLPLLLILLTACTAAPPTSSAIPTLAVLPTAAATATNTPIPTDAPKPTVTVTSVPSALPPTAAKTIPPTIVITDLPSEQQTTTPSPTAIASATITDTLSPRPPTIVATPTNTPSPTWTPSPSAALGTTRGDATVSTNRQQLVDLLSGPGYDFPMIRPLQSSTPLFLIGRSWDNQWYEVRLMDGQEGWIYALYLVIWIDSNRLVVTALEPTQPPVVRVASTSFALGGHIMDLTPRAFDIARSAGMTWIKLQHRFYVGQDAHQELAGAIQSAHDHGFKILLGIVGDKGQMGDLGSYAASYAAFVADVAALGADAIEVWNEPNIDHEWPAGTIYGANYTQLLAAAYTAIKARAPQTIVISAAPAPTGFFGGSGCDTGGCNDDIFFKQMAAAGAANYLDCVGLHHNDGIVSPTSSAGDPRGSYPTYYLAGVISRVPPEFSDKPLCFTELGYLSPEGYGALPGNFGWAGNTTVAEQADWLGQAVQVARSSGRVEMMIVWNVDFTTYSATDPMAGYAIERPGGGCPACDVLRRAIG